MRKTRHQQGYSFIKCRILLLWSVVYNHYTVVYLVSEMTYRVKVLGGKVEDLTFLLPSKLS